jgi:hypothetical protein
MSEFLTSWISKIILLIIGAIILMAQITAGTCGGLIDGIFIGWRDGTGCIGNSGCYGVSSPSNIWDTPTGIIILFILIALMISIYFFVSLLKKYGSNKNESR